MPELADGESVEMQGSGKLPYVLKNVGGVYSCTCPAWRNQSVGIERRTCKHLRKLRGDAAEQTRLGAALPGQPVNAKAAGTDGDDSAVSTAPPLLLAHSWTNDVDLNGWWMSEKLDGVRAYWDGRQFISRLGNLFHAPDWFTECLPTTPLDGELWLARKAFQRTVSIVRRQDKSDLWREISYVVFDAPAAVGGFEERLAALHDTVATCQSKHLQLLTHDLCRSEQHLREELARVEALGGEGLMLRQPRSKYEAGRSTTLLKVKSFHDAEAEVLEHLPGEGRHQGRLGALLVQLADGTKFSVGTGFSDAQRTKPPTVGSTICFRFQELTDRGVPRFPSFVRAVADGKTLEPVLTATPPAVTLTTSKGMPTMATKSTKSPAKAEKSAKPAVAKPAGKPVAKGVGKQYFEFVEGASSKFWEIEVDDCDVTVRYGRIGTNGQINEKSFPDSAAARKHADKLIEEKSGKGYEEKAGGGPEENDDDEDDD